MSTQTIKVRLDWCTDGPEAEADLDLFDSDAAHVALMSLKRVRIQEVTGDELNPTNRIGTVWYRQDESYTYVQGVAFREGYNSQLAKVLPLMLAAQFGYQFVGPYGNTKPLHPSISLIFDKTWLPMAGVAALTRAMDGITGVTVTVENPAFGGSRIQVRPCSSTIEALADASALNENTLSGKLMRLPRLEIVIPGSPDLRVGTVWFYSKSGVCFVPAVSLRQTNEIFTSELRASVRKVLPLLVARILGRSFVGPGCNVPNEHKLRSLVWDCPAETYEARSLDPLDIAPTLEFEVTFPDVVADTGPAEEGPGGVLVFRPWPPLCLDDDFFPDPDPDPETFDDPTDPSDPEGGHYDPLYDSTSSYRTTDGWTWTGFMWSQVEEPVDENDYYWKRGEDGLTGEWQVFPAAPTDNPGGSPLAHYEFNYTTGVWSWVDPSPMPPPPSGTWSGNAGYSWDPVENRYVWNEPNPVPTLSPRETLGSMWSPAAVWAWVSGDWAPSDSSKPSSPPEGGPWSGLAGWIYPSDSWIFDEPSPAPTTGAPSDGHWTNQAYWRWWEGNWQYYDPNPWPGEGWQLNFSGDNWEQIV